MSVEWFAGLYEGEGNIFRRPKKSIQLSVSSTDLDVLEKARDVVGGRVTGPRHDGNPKHKPRWLWSVSSTNEVLNIVHLIYPFLCSRRRSQIDMAIAGLEFRPTPRPLRESEECGFISKDSASASGAKRHRKRGEKPCPSCASAQRNYFRSWKTSFFGANP